MGAEGGGVPGHGRWALWAEGEMTRRANGSAQFDPVAVGAVDWGNVCFPNYICATRSGN